MTLSRKVYQHNSRLSTDVRGLGHPGSIPPTRPGVAFTHAWIPHFIYIQQGFSPSLMTPRSQFAPPSTTSSTCEWDKLNVFEDCDKLDPPGLYLFCIYI